ncbi:MAG: type IX secretion system outer membrane channel protein PorV [Cytophagales bacterium]|nr:type IX secretion system outer membrane channel protein PorV [Cytophagales bacterium]
MIRKFSVFSLGFLLTLLTLQAQTSNDDVLGREGSRIVSSAVPFLTIAPDIRSAALGDAGVALSPDGNAAHWNGARLAFMDGSKYGASLSYSPWLSSLIDDMSLSYLSGFYRLSQEETIALSMTYFDLGSMIFRDETGEQIGNEANPREFAINATYARKLSKKFSIALSVKYVRSNLTGGGISINNGSTETQAGNTAAADLGVFYKTDFTVSGQEVKWNLGANISNLGAKISYTTDDNAVFIPTNLRLGTAFTTDIDEYNAITLTFDANKLMVPTPPTYAVDSDNNFILDDNGNRVIFEGQDPNRSLMSGIFGSFADAPGGFSEEMQEVMLSTGVEYWYDQVFAVRGGYFHEHSEKGARQYYTLGFGLKYQVFGFDFAYLIPASRNNHPLQNTLRFGLSFNFAESNPAEQPESIQD